MYKVKNVTKEVRKFRHKGSSEWVFLEPGKSIEIEHEPSLNSSFEVSEVKEKSDSEKKEKNTAERRKRKKRTKLKQEE